MMPREVDNPSVTPTTSYSSQIENPCLLNEPFYVLGETTTLTCTFEHSNYIDITSIMWSQVFVDGTEEVFFINDLLVTDIPSTHSYETTDRCVARLAVRGMVLRVFVA